MALEISDYLPDYLKDFEDIEDLCYAFEAACRSFEYECAIFEENIRLNSAVARRWRQMTFYQPGWGNDSKKIAILHKLVIKPTIEDYKFFLRHWFKDSVEFELTFDMEENTFFLKIVKDLYYTPEKERCIRSLFPMNSKLVIEFGE